MTIDFGPSCQPQNDNNFLVILKRVFAKENHIENSIIFSQKHSQNSYHIEMKNDIYRFFIIEP